MARIIQHRRGQESNLPTAADGEILFAMDTLRAFFGAGGINRELATALQLANKSDKPSIFNDTTGWWRDPNTGLIIQWGTVFNVTSDGVQVTFPISFTGPIALPVAIALNDSRANASSVAYSNGSNIANFYVRTNGTLNVSWIAVGF